MSVSGTPDLSRLLEVSWDQLGKKKKTGEKKFPPDELRGMLSLHSSIQLGLVKIVYRRLRRFFTEC